MPSYKWASVLLTQSWHQGPGFCHRGVCLESTGEGAVIENGVGFTSLCPWFSTVQQQSLLCDCQSPDGFRTHHPKIRQLASHPVYFKLMGFEKMEGDSDLLPHLPFVPETGHKTLMGEVHRPHPEERHIRTSRDKEMPGRFLQTCLAAYVPVHSACLRLLNSSLNLK